MFSKMFFSMLSSNNHKFMSKAFIGYDFRLSKETDV